jgi:hypothetical protein
MIDKETFVDIINRIQDVEKYHTNLNQFFQQNGISGTLYSPDCTAETLKLLAILMHDDMVTDILGRFCYELDFGKKWKKGCVLDRNGNDIELSSAEKVYDYLTRD